MSGIVVTALGTRAAATSDEDGRYSLAEIPEGEHTLEFRWFGYRDYLMDVTVSPGAVAAVDVALEPTPMLLGEILVRVSSRQPERVVESPSAVAVSDPARVQDLIVTDQVPLFVADLPGVYAMQTGVNTFALNVRGFNGLQNRRMMVLLDGRDVTAPILTTPEWPSISIFEDGSQVELVRGPGSALYGANAFSGVLNIVTPSIRRAVGTRVTIGGGQLSHYRLEGRHALVTEDRRWGFRMQGGYTSSRTWDRSRTNLGDLANEYAEAVPNSASISVPAPGYELIPLKGQTRTTPQGTPGPVTGDPDPMTTARGSARVDYYVNDGSIVTAEGGFTRIENLVDVSSAGRGMTDRSDAPWARLGWAAEGFNLMGYYTGRRGEATLLSSGSKVLDSSDRIHVEGQLNRSFGGERGNVVVGSSFRVERIDSEGTLLAVEHDGRRDEYYSVFGQVSFDVTSDLKAIAAARLDDASLYDRQFAPKVGLVWTPRAGHAVRGTFNQAYLMPSPTQRFLRVPLGPPANLTALEDGLRAGALGPALLAVAPGTLFTNSAAVPVLGLGNERLAAEAVTSAELGYSAQLGRVYLTADAHLSRFEDFGTGLLPGINPTYAPWEAPSVIPEPERSDVEAAVRSAVAGATQLPDGSTAVVFSSGAAGEADQWGFDLSAAVQATDEISLTSKYSYVSVDFKAGSFAGADSIPTNTPVHTGAVAAAYSSMNGVRARVGLTLVDSFNFIWGTWTGEVPSRQTVDLDLGYQVSHQLRVSVSATDVLGQQRFHHFGGSVIGRRILASLTWEP